MENILQPMRMLSLLYSVLVFSAGFVLPIDYLRAQSGANAVLSLEVSTNSFGNWSAVPVAPNMIDTSGRLVSGPVSIGTNTFYRMRITPTPTNTFRGVYMGTHTIGGQFATIVRSDNTATLLVTDSTSPGSLMAPCFSLSTNGSFSATMTDGWISVVGSVSSSGVVSGSIFKQGTLIGTLQGQRKPDTGIHANRDGLWTFGWGVTNANPNDNSIGLATAIAAADGAYVAFIAGEGIYRDGISGQFQTNGAISNTSVRGTIVSAQASSNATAALEGTLTMSNASRGSLIGRLVEPN